MRPTTRQIILLLIIVPAAQPRALAADRPVVQIQAGVPDLHPEKPFLSVEARLAGGVFDQQAEGLLASTDQLTRSVFSIGEAKLARAVTYHGADGDCLAASWQLAGDAGTLNLDDTPYQSTYSLRLRGRHRVTVGSLEAFLGGLVKFNERPLRLNLAGFTIRAGPAADDLLYVVASLSRSEYYQLNVSIWGGTDAHDWYVNLRAPKSALGSPDSKARLVPERFPPLAELMKTWSFDHVWSEVGSRNGSPFAPIYGGVRDQMLIAELAHRGISEEQFVTLLTDKDIGDLRERLREVWWAFSADHAEGVFARYGLAALRRYAQMGARASDTAEAYFANTCYPDFGDLARATLKERIYWTGPINYIGLCSNSADDLRLIQGLTPPDRAEAARSSAAIRLKERLKAQ